MLAKARLVLSLSLVLAALALVPGLANAQGCSDGTREGFIPATGFPDIAGCSGGWSVPGILACQPTTTSPACGRNSGNDSTNPPGLGCNVEDLCAPGWHVCASEAEVDDKTPTTGCSGAVPAGTALFFATRQSSNGCAVCATGTSTSTCCNGVTCCGGCAQTCSTPNDVFGCGTHGVPLSNIPCGVLNRFSGNNCLGLSAPWSCGTSSIQEALNVTKPGSNFGGVLCCKDAGPPFMAKFQYAAKFVCGVNASKFERVLPGEYSTAINIHNPNKKVTRLRKKIALTFPPAGQQPGKVSPFLFDSLRPDEALEVDCGEITREFFPAPIPTPYIKGFVVIESNRSLDVTAVYTAGTLPFGAVSMVKSTDVEQIPERRLTGN